MSREIDRKIIEKILELPYRETNFGLWVILKEGEDAVLFRPSENIQDAWIVLDSVCEKHNWRAIIDRNQTYSEVTFKTQLGSWIQKHTEAESITMAICLACLDTVESEW